MTVLRVTDLSVSYRPRRVSRGGAAAPGTSAPGIRGVSFAVEPGELVAIVGETGSGKTTATLAALGLLPDSAQRNSGTIEVLGHDVSSWSARRFRALHGTGIGYVPQDPTSSFDPLQRIGAQVTEALRVHGDPRSTAAAAHELLSRVGIHDAERVARSYPHQLSGGQRQRALIAGAIALRPALLVADESTSALDVTVQRRVLDLIDELRREDGTGVLLVTHDLAVAAERANHIVVLRNGEVQDSGTVAHILTGQTSAYTRELVAAAPALRTPRARRRSATTLRNADNRPEATIVATQLHKTFGSGTSAVHAVREVSFTVAPGTTHAIVGESGSGKTTVARMVMGLETPTAGTLTVNGTRLAGTESARPRRTQLREFRRGSQLVYQSPYASLTPTLSILDAVAEPIRRFDRFSRHDARRQAAALLDRVSLPTALHSRTPHELSGGQRQRVAIARALAPNPQLVVLDEAVSALDVSVQARILDLLNELQTERGLSYLFVSHDLAVVREISDTVSVMRFGEIVEHGATETLFTQPQHPYTRELLAAAPHVHSSLLHHTSETP